MAYGQRRPTATQEHVAEEGCQKFDRLGRHP